MWACADKPTGGGKDVSLDDISKDTDQIKNYHLQSDSVCY